MTWIGPLWGALETAGHNGNWDVRLKEVWEKRANRGSRLMTEGIVVIQKGWRSREVVRERVTTSVIGT